jgi:hypothetical protein
MGWWIICFRFNSNTYDETIVVKHDHQQTVNGTGIGCGSIRVGGNQMYLNAGVSASSKGFDQSTYTIFCSFDTGGNSSGSCNLLDKPGPAITFKDQTNGDVSPELGVISYCARYLATRKILLKFFCVQNKNYSHRRVLIKTN